MRNKNEFIFGIIVWLYKLKTNQFHCGSRRNTGWFTRHSTFLIGPNYENNHWTIQLRRLTLFCRIEWLIYISIVLCFHLPNWNKSFLFSSLSDKPCFSWNKHLKNSLKLTPLGPDSFEVQNSFELVMVKGTWKSTRLDKIEIISSCTKPTELNESSKVSK